MPEHLTKNRMPHRGASDFAGQQSLGSACPEYLTIKTVLFTQGGVYLYSTIVKEVSTDLGYKTKKCLVKSGKDTLALRLTRQGVSPSTQLFTSRMNSYSLESLQ